MCKHFKYKYGTRSKSRVKLRKTDDARNYLIDQIKHNVSMSEKYEKTLNIWIMINACLF